MYLIKSGRSRKGSTLTPGGELAFTMQKFSFLLLSCLVYLSGIVTASSASSDIVSRASISSIVPSTSSYNRIQSSSSPPSASSPSAVLSNLQAHAAPASQPHQHHQYNSAPNHQPQLQSPQPAAPPTEAYSPSWYNSHMNDPRMGFFFSNSPSAPGAALPSSSSSHSPPKSAPLVPRPRSLSGLFPSASSSSWAASTDKKKKKRKKIKKSKSINNITSNTTISSKADTQPSTDLAAVQPEPASSSRTFLLTPLLAYLVPVFVAQMFGMGMIPAAALITLPIFLLPLGITAAVFLI